jgi:hypothetical protein
VIPIPIFVATRDTLGKNERDFCNAPEDEGMLFPLRPDEDGPHDTMRCMTPGPWRHSNLIKVAWFDGDLEDLDKKILEFLCDDGWVRPKVIQKIGRNFAARISAEAGKYPVGTILEYHDGEVFVERFQSLCQPPFPLNS